MNRNRMLRCLAFVVLFAFLSGRAKATTPAPGFTISTTNITLPISGSGNIPITLSSVNGYTGLVIIGCTTSSPLPGVLEPYCDPPHFGAALSLDLSASEPTVTGNIPITSLPEPVANSRVSRPGLENTAGWALAGVLMLGLGLPPRRGRRPTLLLLVVVSLIGLVGISACADGGSSNHETLTPGTYTYTIRAADQSIPQNSATTIVNVTVPPGIPVQSGS